MQYRFQLRTLLIAIGVISLFLAGIGFHIRRRHQVFLIYKQQRRIVEALADDFVDELKREGRVFVDESTYVGGSGEWRVSVVLHSAQDSKLGADCHVEVMGFVSQNKQSEPTWRLNEPFTISFYGESLDERFVAIVVTEFKRNGWKYYLLDKSKHRPP